MKDKLRLLTIGIVLCCAACFAEDTAVDYERLFAECTGLADVSAAADRFVSTCNDAAAIAFLQTKADDPNSAKLALVSLAKIAAGDQSAKGVLYDYIYGKQPSAVVMLAYLEPQGCRDLAEPLLVQDGPVEIRAAAAEMLGAAGDTAALEMLKNLREPEKNWIVKKSIELAIRDLQHKLANVPVIEQGKWSQDSLLLWRTLKTTVDMSRRTDLVFVKAGAALYGQDKRFAREFLEYRLNCEDLLAVALIGLQKESWAVEGLRRHSQLTGSLGDFSRSALMKIGSDEAVRALHESIIPDGSNRANVHTIMLLELHGGGQSAEFLKKLADDERFSKRHRDYMTVAARNIERRLARQ